MQRTIISLVCDQPKCRTPEDNVAGVAVLDPTRGWTFDVDLCASHRAVYLREMAGWLEGGRQRRAGRKAPRANVNVSPARPEEDQTGKEIRTDWWFAPKAKRQLKEHEIREGDALMAATEPEHSERDGLRVRCERGDVRVIVSTQRRAILEVLPRRSTLPEPVVIDLDQQRPKRRQARRKHLELREIIELLISEHGFNIERQGKHTTLRGRTGQITLPLSLSTGRATQNLLTQIKRDHGIDLKVSERA